jgi:hypothetical protein
MRFPQRAFVLSNREVVRFGTTISSARCAAEKTASVLVSCPELVQAECKVFNQLGKMSGALLIAKRNAV